MIANVALFGPLLLALGTLVFAILTGAAMLQSASGVAGKIDILETRSTELRNAVASLPPLQANPVADPDPEPTEQRPVALVQLSPLENMRDNRFRWLNNFDAELRTCSSSTGLSIGQLTADTWQPETIADRLNRARDEQELREERRGTARLAVEILQVLVSQSDHDLDPGCANPRLQSAIDSLAQLAHVQLYRPEVGDPVDKNLHISLGVEARTGDQLAGTVASVRARGLLDENQAIIAQAEIRVFV